MTAEHSSFARLGSRRLAMKSAALYALGEIPDQRYRSQQAHIRPCLLLPKGSRQPSARDFEVLVAACHQ